MSQHTFAHHLRLPWLRLRRRFCQLPVPLCLLPLVERAFVLLQRPIRQRGQQTGMCPFSVFTVQRMHFQQGCDPFEKQFDVPACPRERQEPGSVPPGGRQHAYNQQPPRSIGGGRLTLLWYWMAFVGVRRTAPLSPSAPASGARTPQASVCAATRPASTPDQPGHAAL